MKRAQINNFFFVFITIISSACYYLIAYILKPTQHVELVTVFAILFASYYFIVRFLNQNLLFLIILGILFRGIFLFSKIDLAFPEENISLLSYVLKPIWGRLSTFNHFFIVSKTLLLISELVTVLLTIQLLKGFKIPESTFSYYFLNPLYISVIMNSHFSLGLFLLLTALCYYYLVKQNNWVSAILYSLACFIVPIFIVSLPFFTRRINNKPWQFLLIVITLLSTIIALFFSEVQSFIIISEDTVYSTKPFYYLFNKLGISDFYTLRITFIGMFSAILLFSFFAEKIITEKQLIKTTFILFLLWMLLLPIINTNYLLILIFYSVFLQTRFVYLWSLLFVCTLIPNINTLSILVIWTIVFGFLFYEWRTDKI